MYSGALLYILKPALVNAFTRRSRAAHAPATRRPGAALLVHFWVDNLEIFTAEPGRRAFGVAPYPRMCRVIFPACLLHASSSAARVTEMSTDQTLFLEPTSTNGLKQPFER